MHSIEEIRKAFSKVHKRACGDTDEVYMSIPADPRRDADLIISAAIDELEQYRNEAKEILATLSNPGPSTETLLALASRGTAKKLTQLLETGCTTPQSS